MMAAYKKVFQETTNNSIGLLQGFILVLILLCFY